MFFDIDGTLLLTDGAGRDALLFAMERVYGTAIRLDGYTFNGKTDPQIVIELLEGTGAELKREGVRARMHLLWPIYLEALARALEERRRAGRILPLPGVRELLAELGRREEVSLGLMTGNIEEAAKLKLAAAGLTAHFEVGAYGSDSEVRLEIARIAVERSRARVGNEDDSVRMVVVGDTPADVACALEIGARAVAVATGRHAVDDLERAGADEVFADLRDTEAVVRSLVAPAVAGPSDGKGNGGTR